MDEQRATSAPKAGHSLSEDRLDSWKEIAVYLKREVRTVQRWEKAAGLPVYRFQVGKQGTVWAYKSELVSWLKNRQPRLDLDPEHEKSTGAKTRRMRWSIVAGLLAVAILVSVAAYFTGNRHWLHKRPIAQKIKLVVLPFQNLSGDATQEYFSDGMTEEMITQLGRLQPERLGVIARTSAMMYKNAHKSTAQICRELGVDYVLEGSVRRASERARITAQLIQCSDQTHVWADSSERDTVNILALQADVAQGIVGEISSNLVAGPALRSTALRTLNADAYDDYLKGRNYARRWTRNDVAKGVEFLERSIQRDPNYAPAYAEVSLAYQALTWFDRDPATEVVPKARAAAAKALALDENLGEAHTVLGLTYGGYEWDWITEERELKLAVQLDPNSSFTHAMYAAHLVTMGRKADAIREIDTALELDPMSPMQHSTASWVFSCARDFDSAIREGRRAVEMDPSFAEGHLMLGSALGAKENFAESFEEWLRYLSLAGDAELARQLATAAKRVSGPGDSGHKLAHIALSYYQAKAKTQYVAPMTFAGAYMNLDDKERTLEWLDKAYQEHAVELAVIAINPEFDPLRSDPRFQDLLRRMNLPVDSASANTRYN